MMRLNKHTFSLTVMIALLMVFSACQRDEEDLDPVTYPEIPEVFIDGFSSGLQYAAFGGSKVTAFEVDEEVSYKGIASMRFDVPDAGDPAGGFAGGVFSTDPARDLSGYTTLTFWARASQPANIDLIGFGNDLGENRYETSIAGVPVTSAWQKYYIPIPDPSLLTAERGMLYYAEPPEDSRGYSFWIDEVQFENLGTITHERAQIFNGQNEVQITETGASITIPSRLFVNLPSGIDQEVNIAPAYLSYKSSDPSVAEVNEAGVVTVVGQDTAVITAELAGEPVEGSLTVISTGSPEIPANTAPVPDKDPSTVISMYSNAYDDVPIDTWNTRWEFSNAEDDEFQVNGDDIRRYTMLNFVGIEFASQTIDASEMTHFHMDFWTPIDITSADEFKVLLIDFGANGVFDGGDDSQHELTFTPPLIEAGQWVSIDVPLSSFSGLASREHLAQMVLSGSIPTVFIDNVYFYEGEEDPMDMPSQPAPTPNQNAADVLSIYSDAYTSLPGTDFFPDWGQNTVVSEGDIQGDNVLIYNGLNFQGIILEESQDVSTHDFVHVDFWSANSSELNFFLISPGPQEIGYSLNVPTSGWGSADIPLSEFSGVVDLTDVFQMKFDGNGDIYIDNIYFYTDTGTGGGDEPTEAAPTPSLPEADVISLFSDAYSDVNVDTYLTEWSSATLEETDVAGNAVLKYTEVDFLGMETTSSTIDVSEMTHFHIDVWSPDFTQFNIKLVDFGPDGEFDGGDDTEHELVFTAPAQGEWVSYDIDLSDFVNLTSTENMAQYIFVGRPIGANTLYFDNIYFHK